MQGCIWRLGLPFYAVLVYYVVMTACHVLLGTWHPKQIIPDKPRLDHPILERYLRAFLVPFLFSFSWAFFAPKLRILAATLASALYWLPCGLCMFFDDELPPRSILINEIGLIAVGSLLPIIIYAFLDRKENAEEWRTGRL